MEKKEERTENLMLQRLMSLLPEYTTKCSTAQHKSVQHNAFDDPKECWCCWVMDAEGNKHFAMYFDLTDEVKVVSEEKRKSYIVKQIK